MAREDDPHEITEGWADRPFTLMQDSETLYRSSDEPTLYPVVQINQIVVEEENKRYYTVK
jgi:hypothetical protein